MYSDICMYAHTLEVRRMLTCQGAFIRKYIFYTYYSYTYYICVHARSIPTYTIYMYVLMYW